MTDTQYISVIGILWGSLVAMALYIRKSHIEALKEKKESSNKLLEVVTKNTEAFIELKGSVQSNTQATTTSADQMERSMDRLSGSIENLNKEIIRKARE